MSSRIVIYAHRYKRPPATKKAVAIECGPIVARPAELPATTPAEPERPKRPQPKVKDTPVRTSPVARIVVGKGAKELKGMRADRMADQPRAPDPKVEAFFARNVRPGGPLAPPRNP